MEKKKHDHGKNAADHREQEAPAEAAAAPAEEVAVNDRIKELEETLGAKEAEARQNWDKFLRERADLENYRKRVQREKEEILKYGNESLIMEILPVIDNMERALAHAEGDSSAVIDGIRLTHGMLLSALKKFGVTPIETAPGAPFDSAVHQAMQQVEGTDFPPNGVVQEFQRGYLLNERLLRPAMVSVAKG